MPGQPLDYRIPLLEVPAPQALIYMLDAIGIRSGDVVYEADRTFLLTERLNEAQRDCVDQLQTSIVELGGTRASA